MVARLNDALDRYWFLAVSSANKGGFDDSGYSTLPVETQSLVAGTNAYKMTSFTNEVLQILRLSILDDDGIEYDLIHEEFDDIVDFNETYSTDSADRGKPQYWTKKGDYIYLYPCPDYSETNGLRAYVNRKMSKFVWTTFTTTFASDLINSTTHGLTTDDGIITETDNSDLPSGITADTVVYYVIASGLTADVFKVSTTIGGSTITIADDGTGNHKYTEVTKEPGIPSIHHLYLAKRAALAFMNPKHPNFAKINAEIQQFEQDIMDYWRTMESENKTIINTNRRAFK